MTTVEDIRRPVIVASQRRAPEKIALGDTVTIEDGPELLIHLASKVPEQSHGVGIAMHPGTTVPLGLGIDAAIEAADGRRLGLNVLRYCSFSMERRITRDLPFRAIGRVAELGARHVECTAEVWQGDHVVCKLRVGLCQPRDGQAAPLSKYYLLDTPEGV
jgi:hypothetical protein